MLSAIGFNQPVLNQHISDSVLAEYGACTVSTLLMTVAAIVVVVQAILDLRPWHRHTLS
jgi:ABC-type sulfate transport system permease subunit